MLMFAAVLLYAFLVGEMLREILRKQDEDDESEYEGSWTEGEGVSDYDEKDELSMLKRALGQSLKRKKLPR